RTPSERFLFVNECYSNFAAASGVKARRRATARTFLYSLPIFPVNPGVKHPRRRNTQSARALDRFESGCWYAGPLAAVAGRHLPEVGTGIARGDRTRRIAMPPEEAPRTCCDEATVLCLEDAARFSLEPALALGL